MAFDDIVRYHGRLNTTVTPNRKEWRRVGVDTIVVGGGSVTPGTPVNVSLSASPNPSAAGATVTLTAAVSGGTTPYTYTFSQTAGLPVTLSGTGATRTFTAAASSGSRTFRVHVADSTGNQNEATVAHTINGAVVGQPLYAGHIPNRVLVGVAGPEADSPSWDEGLEIIKVAAQAQLGSRGAGSYERRRFSSTGTNGTHASELRGMLADGDAFDQYNWVSFKVINNNWAAVANGTYPAIPAMFRQVAEERAAAGKTPFMATLHHEPRGNGDLNAWADMQMYMSDQLKDINDILAWSAIGNGFLWNSMPGTASNQTERVQMFPQALIDMYRQNKHVVAVDTYDDHPTYTGQETYPVGGQNNRCSEKLLNWINWMRARNCGALGIGEWSVTDVGEMPKVWQVMRNNRDILGVTNYFNSIAGGSTWDWRLIPANYPTQPGNPGTDYGGTALTAGRLNYFPTIVAESTSATYTSPL